MMSVDKTMTDPGPRVATPPAVVPSGASSTTGKHCCSGPIPGCDFLGLEDISSVRTQARPADGALILEVGRGGAPRERSVMVPAVVGRQLRTSRAFIVRRAGAMRSDRPGVDGAPPVP